MKTIAQDVASEMEIILKKKRNKESVTTNEIHKYYFLEKMIRYMAKYPEFKDAWNEIVDNQKK